MNSLLQYPSVMEDIYRENGEQMIWFDLQQGSSLEFQLEVIQHAGFSPLFFSSAKLPAVFTVKATAGLSMTCSQQIRCSCI
ncbi:hypothetical protein QW180_17585 [Vibrio sinaloensis]|nr:hypothetical protein [Vibrio sinaloensis]